MNNTDNTGPGSPLRPALTVAEGLNADAISFARRASRDLGIPEQWVRGDLARIEREMAARRIEKNPALELWARQSPENAALAREDPEGLAGVADAVEQKRAALPDTSQHIEITDENLAYALAGPYAGADRDAQRAMAKQVLANSAGFWGGVVRPGAAVGLALAENLAGENSVPAQWMRGADSWIKSVTPNIEPKETAFGQYWLNAVQNVPQMGIQFLAGALGGPQAAMAVGGIMQFGSMYADLRDKGVSPQGSAIGAGLGTAMIMPFDRFGIDRAFDLFRSKGARHALIKGLAASGGEGITEAIQKFPENFAMLWAESELHGKTAQERLSWFADTYFSRENLENTAKEAWREGLLALPWGVLGGGGKFVSELSSAQWTNHVSNVRRALQKSKLAQAHPELAKRMLEDMDPEMGQSVMLPADKVLELFQQGTDILTPLELDPKDVERLANMGRSVDVPVSDIVARLDDAGYRAVERVMIPGSEGVSLSEIEDVTDEEREHEAAEAARVYDEYAREQSEYDAAATRLRADVESAVAASPNLAAQAQSMAGGVKAYVDTMLEPLEGFARRMEAIGVPRAETLGRIRPDLDAVAREWEARELEAAKREAGLSPLVRHIRGRLDGKSLKRDFPGVYRELRDIYGPGLFGKNGLAVDLLADELVTAGLLEPGSGANELVERLRNGERGLFQVSEEDVRLAEKKLAEDVKAWEKTVDGFMAGTLNERKPVTMLNNTPLVLTLFGTDKNLQVATNYTKLTKILKDKHKLSESVLKQVPSAMTDPVMIFDSATVKGDYVMMLDLKDENGATIIVPLSLNYDDLGGYTVNYVPSVYAKANTETTKPNNAWFIRQVGENRLRYINHKKSREWVTSSGLQLPRVGSRPSNGKNRIFTETDLVKLKNAYPGYYQTAWHGTPHRFDTFSLDAIGTGEGAQAHGWGLYFARDRGTGEKYKIGLGVNITLDGKPFYDGVKGVLESSTGNSVADDTLLAFHGNIDEAMAELRDDVDYGIPEAVDALEVLRSIKADNRLKVEERGQLFEVDIPENDVLLDEQKTLEEQPHIAKLLDEYAEKIGDWSFSAIEAFPEDWTGREIYRFLSEHLGSSRAASEYLNAAGIKGITYEGGQDGRCFVVFDDKAIDVLNTFYQGRGMAEARGSVVPVSEGYLVSLFSRANLSTLPHELGHIFRMEMQRAVDMGLADEAMLKDHQTFEKWLSRFDDNATLEAEYNERLKNNPTFKDRAFSSLSPEEIVQVRETAKHEYFARGFEAYLREGKAPSKGLEGAFQRFRKWLMAIYRSAKKLGVELNDDVREAFDRMIVEEREMNAEAARNELLSLDEKRLDALGLSGPDREYAAGLMKAAISHAADERRRDLEKARKERMRDYARQARETLIKEPVYTALEAARKTPLDMALVVETVGERDAKALFERHARIMNEGGMGLDPELLAAEHGYRSASAMIADMLRAEPLDAAVQKRAEVMAEQIEAELFRPEEYLLSSEKVQEQLELVARHLSEKSGETVLDRRAFAEVASRELAAMPMDRAVSTGRFLADLRRVLRRERNALRSGDMKAALAANNMVRLNFELARQSRDARMRLESARSGISRFLKQKNANPDAKYAVMLLAMNHGLGRWNEALARGRGPESMDAWFAGLADKYEFLFDPATIFNDARPWREMTLADFTELHNAVKQIVTVELNEREFLSGERKRDIAELAVELAEQARREYKTRPERRVEKERLDTPKKWLRTLHAQLMKVEFICNMLDGGEHGGIWERTIFRPIADAEVKRDLRLKKEVARMRSEELFGRYDAAALRQKELVKTVGEAFTLEQRLMVALNMGNEGNYERLKAGFGWTDEQLADIVSSLSKEDWDFVTNVWKYLESFRKEAFAVERTLTGIEPKAVEARPFMTPHGEVPGGYFPVAYDPEKGAKAFERAQKADDKKLLGGRNYGSAQTAHGHLKARAKAGTGEPLDLSFSVIGNHVFDVVHDFTFRIPVLDVAKVLRNKEVQTALNETVGPEMARLFMPWLQDVSMMRRDPSSLWEKSLSKARSLTTTYGLGYKLTVLVQQGTGYLQTIDTIGLGNTARGVAKVFENANRLKEFFNETCELSPFMALRMESFDRDIKDIDRRIIPQKGIAHAADVARDWSMKTIGLCQMGVDLGTWWGAYEKRMRETRGDMTESVAYADSIVRMTQGGGGTKDLSRVQRGSEATKLLTMFYSFFNVQYNLWARRAHLTKSARDVPKAMNTVFLTAILGPILSEILAGRGPDDDDDESWLGWGAKNVITYPFMTIPGVRDVVNGIAGDYGYRMTPLEQTFKRVVRLADAVKDAATGEEDWSRAGREAVEIGGILSNGLITQQMVTTGLGLVRFLEGDDFELADLARRRKRGQ